MNYANDRIEYWTMIFDIIGCEPIIFQWQMRERAFIQECAWLIKCSNGFVNTEIWYPEKELRKTIKLQYSRDGKLKNFGILSSIIWHSKEKEIIDWYFCQKQNEENIKL